MGAGWYFAVKEGADFFGADTLRVAHREIAVALSNVGAIADGVDFGAPDHDAGDRFFAERRSADGGWLSDSSSGISSGDDGSGGFLGFGGGVEAGDIPAIERMIHDAVNAERAAHGLHALAWQPEVAAIARAHSVDMVARGYYDHLNLDGEDPTARALRFGYPCRKAYSYGLAENIMQGDVWHSKTIGLGGGTDWMSVGDVVRMAVDGWMDSPGHRENILMPRYDRSGVGGALDGDVIYLTQNFC